MGTQLAGGSGRVPLHQTGVPGDDQVKMNALDGDSSPSLGPGNEHRDVHCYVAPPTTQEWPQRMAFRQLFQLESVPKSGWFNREPFLRGLQQTG